MPSRPCQPPDIHFLFQHGWGFSGDCWRGWLLALSSSPYTLGNRGYWGLPRQLEFHADRPGFALICHSLGLHFLPRELLCRAGLLVIISGFAHFHGQVPTAGRFSRKHVRKMLSRMRTDPADLIHDFYRDCGCADWPVNKETMNSTLLIEDLTLLDQNRLDKGHCTGLPPALLLHGREDRIVPLERAEELAELLDQSQLTVVDGAGHGLPFTHPLLCLDIIRAFREKIC